MKIYIWVINNFIAYIGVIYIWGLTVFQNDLINEMDVMLLPSEIQRYWRVGRICITVTS